MPRALCVILAGVIGLAVVLPPTSEAHERKEVAGLSVLFGAEPEPALTEEVEWLRWRFTSLETDEPFTAIEEAQAIVRRDGQEYGPFELRGPRNEPGLHQSMHIFTAAGDYETVLSFKKKGNPTTHTLAFTYHIRDRKEFSIPD